MPKASLTLGTLGALALVALATGCSSDPDDDANNALKGKHAHLVKWHAPALPERLVVDFDDGTPLSDIDQWEQRWGIDLRFNSVMGTENGVAIADVAGMAPAQLNALLQSIRKHPSVEAAEPSFTYRVNSFRPNDPDYRYQWHFDKVNAPKAWDFSRGAGVTVAVIDTGIAYAKLGSFLPSEDFAGIRFAPGYDFVNDRAEAIDDHGHGTHVAGTVAEATHNKLGPAGLAHGATLMPIKVLSAAGYGSVEDIADGIRWAADHGAQVINMSLGGGAYSEVLDKACQYARDNGVVVIAAAGNTGFGEVEYPAAYDSVVAVSATRFDDKLAPYSSHGKALDIAAPGGDMSVDQNGDGKPDGVYQNTIDQGNPAKTAYAFFQGTSMAAPHVAAAAALVMASGITRPEQVEKVLFKTARKVPGQSKWDTRHGHGVLDAGKAASTARFRLGMGRTLALGLILVLLALGRRRTVKLGWSFYAAAVVTGVGVFFLPWLVGMFPGRGFLDTPAMDWGLNLLGAGSHAHALAWSALVPGLLVVLLYGQRRLRPALAGICAGAAGFLLAAAVQGQADVHWIPGRTMEALWLGGNALVCFIGARLVMARETA